MSIYLLLILGILFIISLTLSIISFVKHKDSFGQILSPNDCIGLSGKDYRSCVRHMNILSTNIDSQYQGQPANRRITHSGGVYGGSFGNPNILEPEVSEGPKDFYNSDDYN